METLTFMSSTPWIFWDIALKPEFKIKKSSRTINIFADLEKFVKFYKENFASKIPIILELLKPMIPEENHILRFFVMEFHPILRINEIIMPLNM